MRLLLVITDAKDDPEFAAFDKLLRGEELEVERFSLPPTLMNSVVCMRTNALPETRNLRPTNRPRGALIVIFASSSVV